MKREDIIEAIALLQGALDGGEIQEKSRRKAWREPTYDSIVIGDPDYKYRIKPKAREFWLNPNAQSPDTAFYENFDPDDADFIKVREVLGGE